MNAAQYEVSPRSAPESVILHSGKMAASRVWPGVPRRLAGSDPQADPSAREWLHPDHPTLRCQKTRAHCVPLVSDVLSVNVAKGCSVNVPKGRSRPSRIVRGNVDQVGSTRRRAHPGARGVLGLIDNCTVASKIVFSPRGFFIAEGFRWHVTN